MAKPAYRAYTVIKRENKDDYWLNLGVAFPHEDGEGFNLLLQALPLDGKIVLRTYKEDEEEGLSYILQELNAQGYWDAEAKVAKHEPDPTTGAVKKLQDQVRFGFTSYNSITQPTLDPQCPKLTRSLALEPTLSESDTTKRPMWDSAAAAATWAWSMPGCG